MPHLQHGDLLKLFGIASGVLGADYGAQRATLFSGVPGTYLAGLPVNPQPGPQLFSDLGRLNDDVVLAGGVVPLELWLRNVIALYSFRPGIGALADVLEGLKRDLSGAAPEVASRPADGEFRLEAIIGRDETVAFPFLSAGALAGRSVAKLLVPRHEGGQTVLASDGNEILARGSGWLLASELLITNHHVVNARALKEADASQKDFDLQGGATRAIFDFDGEEVPGTTVPSAKVELADKGLDFAILRLGEAQDGRPLPSFRSAPIQASPQNPFPLNIIQHPYGNAKRVALRNNLLYEISGDFVRYRTDTDEGSSGSPVYDDAWKVVALHRAAKRNLGSKSDLPVINEGVLWTAIRGRIEGARPDLLDEIGQDGD
jgi:hypothetical protein